MSVYRLCHTLPLLILLVSPTLGQQQASKEAAPLRETSLERRAIDAAIKDLKFFRADQTLPLRPHLVLRWPNPVRTVTAGATAIWTQDGRPKAACCIWTGTNGVLSLSPGLLSEDLLVATLDGKTIWRPKSLQSAATGFRSIPGAPPPAKTKTQRLRQMKLLANRFSSDFSRADDREAFRLLPSPIYRYQLPPQPADAAQNKLGHDVLDGAMFAFVQGTDPETLMMIEARPMSGSYQWSYAAAKRTRSPIRLFLDGKLVASLEESPYDNREADFTWWGHRKVVRETAR